MFRMQDNVPEVYVEESRDFQIFCRAMDSVFSGVKFSTDALIRTSSTADCQTSLLKLLATKLGFFTNKEMTDDVLRGILESFIYLVNLKGSKEAIVGTIRLFQRLLADESLTCDIKFGDDPQLNRTVISTDEKNTIYLEFNSSIENYDILLELLQFVAPTGYTIQCTSTK